MNCRSIGNEEAKELMLSLLLKFAGYCQEHNLRYFLAYGTLLGAVRHKGYIPWDNDIDVWMPRPDYERFRVMAASDPVSPEMSCLDYHETRTFPFLKAIDNRTALREHFLVTEENLGLYIDIFPLDGLPDDDRKIRKILSKSETYNKLFALANYRFNTGSSKVIRFMKNIFYPILRLLSNRWICERINRLCEDYNFDKSFYVGNIVWGYPSKERLQKAWFEPTEGIFEHHNFVIPKGYDSILRTYYGDYMRIPPKEKRVTHYYDVNWK